jgi:hypothetical protein
VVSPTYQNPAGAQTPGSVGCSPGKKVLGGGVEGTGDTTQTINGSYPRSSETEWRAVVNNTSTTASGFIVYAICGFVG